jgi:hypothetical protein
MSLETCLVDLGVDSQDAAQFRQLAQRFGGDAAGVQAYLEQIQADRELVRAQLIEQGVPVNVMVEPVQSDELFQSTVPLQRRPARIPGTGPHGRVRNWDFAQFLTDRHMSRYGRALDPADPNDFDLIVDELQKEYDEQLSQQDSGHGWYVEDIAAAIETTKYVIPELADPVNRDLFLTLAALLSPQEKPVTNWEKAIVAMQGYLETGRIPTVKPNGKGFGVNALALPLLQKLIDEHGVAGALEWVQTPKTGREVAEFRRSTGIYKEGDQTRRLGEYGASEFPLGDTQLGIYMFGPKVGDFMMNSTGIDHNAVTVDLWLARTYNRMIGRLTDVPPEQRRNQEIVSEIRSPAERAHIKNIVRELARRNEVDPSAMQAALWYFEQRLYRNHGINSDSQNFSGAAVRAAQKREIALPGTGEAILRTGEAPPIGIPTAFADDQLFQGQSQDQEIAPAELDLDAINEIEVEGTLNTPEEKAAHQTRAQIKQQLYDAGYLTDDALDELSNFAGEDSYTDYINEALERVGDMQTVEEKYASNLEDAIEDGDAYRVDDFVIDTDILEFSKIAKGVTDDIRLAGYILPDGAMLDFSAGQGARVEDHRQLNMPMVVPAETGRIGTEQMIAFQRAGAMRVDANAGLVDLEVTPTSRQLRMIEEVFDAAGGEGWVELADGGRKARFAINDARKAAGLIRRFYSGEDISQDEFFQGQSRYAPPGLGALFNPVVPVVNNLKLPAWKKPDGVASGADIVAGLKGADFGAGVIKKDALELTGIVDFLTMDPNAKFTREQVADFLEAGGVNVQEVIATEDGGFGEDGFNWSVSTVTPGENYAAEAAVQDALDRITERLETTPLDELTAEGLDLAKAVARLVKRIPRDTQDGRELRGLLDHIAEIYAPFPTPETQTLDMFEADPDRALELDTERWLGGAFSALAEDLEAREAFDPGEERTLFNARSDALREVGLTNRVLSLIYDEVAQIEYDADPLQRFYDERFDVEIIGNDAYGYVINDDTGNRIMSLGEAEIQAEDMLDYSIRSGDSNAPTAARWSGYTYGEGQENYKEVKMTLPEIEGDFYKTAHYPDRNILAFLRMTEWSFTAAPTREQREAIVEVREFTPEEYDAAREAGDYGLAPGSPAAAALDNELTRGQAAQAGEPNPGAVIRVGFADGEPVVYGIGTAETVREQTVNNHYTEHRARQRGNARPTTVVQELQSDWHQQGRQYGYKTEEKDAYELVAEARDTLNQTALMLAGDKKLIDGSPHPDTPSEASQQAVLSLGKEMFVGGLNDIRAFPERVAAIAAAEDPTPSIVGGNVKEFFKRFNALRNNPELDTPIADIEYAVELNKEAQVQRKGVPDAPFKGDSWLKLAISRALIDAVEQGSTQFAWVNAEVLKNHRWSEAYTELYENQYDKKMPSIIQAITGQVPTLVDANGFPITVTTRDEWLLPKNVAEGASTEAFEAARAALAVLEEPASVTPEELSAVLDARDKVAAEVLELERRLKENGAQAGVKLDYNNGTWVVARTTSDAQVEGRGDTVEAAVKEFNKSVNDAIPRHGKAAQAGFWVVELTDEFSERVRTQGLSMFQNPDDPLGRMVNLPDGSTLVDAFEGADMSTLLHESGHLFVKLVADLAQTSERFAEIQQAFLDFTGATSMEELDVSIHGDAARAKQEMLAEAFEKYLMEGKAPSPKLQSAFATYKAWLLKVYDGIRRTLGIEINDDIRRAFDRMLATDEEIAYMQQVHGFDSDSNDAILSLMPPEMRAARERLTEMANEASANAAAARENAARTRMEQASWKREHKRRAAAALEEIYKRPEHRAFWYLTRGEFRGEEPTLTPNRRIDRDAIVELGYEPKDFPVSSRAVYTTDPDTALDPDVMAAMLGFDSGVALLEALQDLPKAETLAQEQAQAEMIAEHGEMATPDDLSAQIEEAAYNADRAAAIQLELDALAKQTGQAKASRPLIKATVTKILDETSIRDALQPQKHLTASIRAAEAAAAAAAKKDWQKAYDEKMKHLLNHELYRETLKAREEVEAGLRYMRKFSRRGKNFPALDADYVDRIKELTDAYQLTSEMSERTRAKLEVEAFKKFLDEAQRNDGAIFNIPQAVLDADEKTHYRRLTLFEFRGLHAAVKNLEAQARLKKEGINAEERARIADLADRAEAAVAGRSDTWAARQLRQQQSLGGMNEALNVLKYGDASLTKTEFLLELLDGGKQGVFYEGGFAPVVEAEYQENILTRENSKRFHAAYEALPAEVRKKMSKRVMVPELGRKMTRSELLALALNVGNESNLDKVVRGSETDASGAPAMTEESIMAALDRLLSKEEWDFVQEVWDTFQDMYPGVEAVFRKEFGRSPEQIPAKAVETRHGTYRGGYFPMMYDPKRSSQAREIEKKSALEELQSEVVQASVFSGMTKERTSFAAPVLLDLTRVAGALQQTAHYVTHYDAVRAMKKFYAHPKVRQAVVDKLGQDYYDLLTSWVSQVATGGRDPKVQFRIVDDVVESVRNNVTVATMGGLIGGSATTLLSQPLGLATSIDALARGVDPANQAYRPDLGVLRMLGGLAQMLNPGAISAAWNMSKELRFRLDNADREIRNVSAKLKGMKGRKAQVQRAMLIGIPALQLVAVDMPTFIAAYNMALKANMSEEQAVAFADGLVRKTQGSGSVKDLSPLLATRGAARGLTMFMTFFNTLYAIQRRMTSEAKLDVNTLNKAVFGALFLWALPSLVEGLFRMQTPDEDDEESLAEWLFYKTLMMPLSTIPIVRDVASSFERGQRYAASPIEGYVAQAIKAVDDMLDEDEEMDAAALRAAITGLGLTGYVPSSFINRIIRTMENIDDGEDWSVWEFFVGPKPDK